ncbi:hypothetical protein APHMUC_0727 [Anaplasma phagocytophilum str. ApMUC09]|uniref:Uncharacterized protein n=1 Tax=Anaplasma phagocytophilum str. ApMUC09 TaxID=1359152 RepID=A0A0F3N7C3_ANAPH|nr:hypothetical protein APHMUC_0727 [Anaplasma phagocytophilum str. ApMUC09]
MSHATCGIMLNLWYYRETLYKLTVDRKVHTERISVMKDTETAERIKFFSLH